MKALTDMLWSIYHFSMELTARETIDTTPDEDLEHLRGDAERAYGLLCIEWLEYMKHLKEEYPYLYSFALRTNPFKEAQSGRIQIKSFPASVHTLMTM